MPKRYSRGKPRSGPALGLGQLGHCLGPLTREGPKFGGKFFYLFFIYKYFWEILKHFSLHFFSLLRRLKELSNARDKDKTNLNKKVLQIDVLLDRILNLSVSSSSIRVVHNQK